MDISTLYGVSKQLCEWKGKYHLDRFIVQRSRGLTPQQEMELMDPSKNLSKWESIRKAFEACPSNSFAPSWLSVLSKLGGLDVTGLRMLEKIQGSVTDELIATRFFSESIDKYLQTNSAFINRLAPLVQFFRSAKLETDFPDEKCGTVGFWYPSSNLTTKRLQDYISKHEKYLSLLSEISGSKEGVRLYSVNKGSFGVIFEVGSEVIDVICNLLQMAVLAKQLGFDFEKNRQDFIKKDIWDRVKDVFISKKESEEKKLLNDQIEKLHELVEESDADEARKNELKNAAGECVAHFRKQADANVSVEALPPSGESPESEIVKKSEAVRRDLLSSGSSMELLLLEAPKSQEEADSQKDS